MMESLLKPYVCAQAADATHLSLIGGKFTMDPPDRFHRIYSKMYTQGAHLVEKVRYPSKFYLDYDKVSRSFVDSVLIPHLRQFQSACVVCVPLDSWDGVHVIFSNLVVHDKSHARSLAETFSDQQPSLVDYDVSVYASGLRMIGSKKKTVARVYMPYMVLDDNGKDVPIEMKITPDMLRLCSIHLDPNAIGPSIGPPIGPSIGPNVMEELPYNMKKLENGRYYWFTKDKYCANIGREHKSANRMYEFDPVNKRVRVRCSCKCKETGCQDYRGPWETAPIILYPYMESVDDRPWKQSQRVYRAFDNYAIRDMDSFIENLFG